MLVDFLWILLGLAGLVLGGEVLVRGATGLAVWARISSAVIGLTVVAIGTSFPELVVSFHAALRGNPGIAVGNVVGSNIFNIVCVLGVVALVRPLKVLPNMVKVQWPILMLACCLFYFLTMDEKLSRAEGASLLFCIAAFFVFTVWHSRKNDEPTEEPLFTASLGQVGVKALGINLFAVVLGGAFLSLGSSGLLHGAVNIAEKLEVTDTLIGLTLVSLGTSAPELATCLAASLKGKDDMALGNALGSSIFNVLGILGPTALLQPIPIYIKIIERDNLWMLGVTFVLLPLMAHKKVLGRWKGALLLGLYVLYLKQLIL